ncbi:hypothetical protein LCGC14_0891150 [marine sediment metagenome]|uniref:Uncharacterized protein n=1 Tax=marine sediment metagenome TaxID=412755 RepID=A0A0F9S695_9ZZZZ
MVRRDRPKPGIVYRLRVFYVQRDGRAMGTETLFCQGRSDRMRNLLVVLIAIILLTGCDNSMKAARARALNYETDQLDDIHQQKMREKRRTEPLRLMIAEVSYNTLAVIIMVGATAGTMAFIYFLLGWAYHKVQGFRFRQISLDKTTKQYPLLLYGGGQFVFNPNNGELKRLSETSVADQRRIEATAKVQIAGLLADHSQIERGWIDEIQT